MEYLSLYRRYRPRRFSEIRGQDHVVAALSNAIREDRVFHAYLLSGPRGTGKTTAARILAKALNCINLADGEPCCECESCVSIESGTSFDLHELDAASNNKVDDVRDLLGKVSLGTPGRTKVYLLDEVHMLTSGAENALLKTLEEPPAHVVFVMATTEPHKVVDTIRSRAQHLELNLLSSDHLESLVRDVVVDAGLDVGGEGIGHAVRSARGSARDALSALDRVVAGGMVTDDTTTTDLLEAIAGQDTVGALGALASGISRGREPRVVGEGLLAALREAFLLAMGLPIEQLEKADQKQAESFANQVTPAVITRSLEVLGAALVEMRRAPDPRVDLEVALVRMTGAALRTEPEEVLESLIRRIEKLEEALAQIARPVSEPPPPPPNIRPKPGPAAQARAALGRDVPQQPVGQATALTPDSTSEAVEATPTPMLEFPDRDDLTLAWGDEILPSLSKKARARFAAGRFIDVEGGSAVFGLPNEPHLRRCSEVVTDVEAALTSHFGMVVSVRLIVDDGRMATPSAPMPLSPPIPADDEVDLTGLVNADIGAGSAVEKLSEAFPGSSLVDPE